MDPLMSRRVNGFWNCSAGQCTFETCNPCVNISSCPAFSRLVCGKKPYLVQMMSKALAPLVRVLYHRYMLISLPQGLTHWPNVDCCGNYSLQRQEDNYLCLGGAYLSDISKNTSFVYLKGIFHIWLTLCEENKSLLMCGYPAMF